MPDPVWFYVLSWERGDRESCSIFYATYLATSVDADEALKDIFGVDDLYTIPEKEGLPRFGTDDPDELIAELGRRGVTAWTLAPTFVIQEPDYGDDE